MAWGYTNDYSSTILAYTSGAGSITVVSVTGLPASGRYFILKVDDEYFLCTSYTGLVLTVTGGQAGSTPANHSLGAAITGCWIVPSVLNGIKSDVIAASALVLLEQHTASNSATLDFTACISSSHDEYEIHFVGIVPASNNISFQMNVSTDGGSTYVGGTSYTYLMFYSGVGDSPTQTTGSGVAAIDLAHSVSNTANYSVNGRINLYSPGGSGYKFIEGKIQSMVGSGSIYQWENIGIYLAATAVNALRFFFSGGNIASGTIRIYGVAK